MEISLKSLIGLIKKILKRAVKDKRLKRWKQMMNSFTWTLRYLLGVETAISDWLSRHIKEDSQVRKIHRSEAVVAAITKDKIDRIVIYAIHKNLFRPGKKKLYQMFKGLQEARGVSSNLYIYSFLVISLCRKLAAGMEVNGTTIKTSDTIASSFKFSK
jgi:hypothetical protein